MEFEGVICIQHLRRGLEIENRDILEFGRRYFADRSAVR